MNAVHLALEKQRLQLASAAQRDAMARYLEGLAPVFDAAERAHAGLQWTRRHPEAVVGALGLLAALRPGARRFLWRWGSRGFVVWRTWRDSERWLQENRIPSAPNGT